MATVIGHAARLVALSEINKSLMEEKAHFRAEFRKTLDRWDANVRARVAERESTQLEAAINAVSNIRGIA